MGVWPWDRPQSNRILSGERARLARGFWRLAKTGFSAIEFPGEYCGNESSRRRDVVGPSRTGIHARDARATQIGLTRRVRGREKRAGLSGTDLAESYQATGGIHQASSPSIRRV